MVPSQLQGQVADETYPDDSTKRSVSSKPDRSIFLRIANDIAPSLTPRVYRYHFTSRLTSSSFAPLRSRPTTPGIPFACQNTIYRWARDHRVHHKYADTDADPHNATKGMFFSHIGWLLIRKHPKVKTIGATIDCSDVAQDPFVAFQAKYDEHAAPSRA